MAMMTIVPALLDFNLSDIDMPPYTVSKELAEQLFIFFKQHPLFNWTKSNNGCEGRADAVCVLLDEWHIPNYKGWVFGGAYLKQHVGALKQNWKYHVAAMLAVRENGQVVHYILDPATANTLQPIDAWAASITELPHSYYFTREAHWYIFPDKNISTKKWNTRNKQNRKWMIQCLTGINGLTSTGKAILSFNKERIKNTVVAFRKAKLQKPAFINDHGN
jgi:hypothetical protein